MRRRAVCAILLAGTVTLAAACAPPPSAVGGATRGSRAQQTRDADALAALGRDLFRDTSLSISGRLSCATCHRPELAFGPAGPDPIAYGGPDGRSPGVRAVPSLRYLQDRPAFTEHFFESEDEADESIDAGPTGGLTWDGRLDRLRDQARIPLFSPFEMANASPAAVAARALAAPYGAELRRLSRRVGASREDAVFDTMLEALEAYQQNADEFYPYTSRYDAFLAGEAPLSAPERRGLALFNDPAKGNCARCHPSARGLNGAPPQFTDYGFVALDVPRNPAIPANASSSYYDLGLCGPLRTDLVGRTEYCGTFRTPSLRNVAIRRVFFHNGVLHSLADVVDFYAERDSNPAKWYGVAAANEVAPRSDLPARFRDNVDRDPPFGRRPGDPPALTPPEIDDIVAFLGTLTDGARARGGSR